MADRPFKNHMSTQRDYYEVLGVQKGAAVDDVKSISSTGDAEPP